MDFLDILLEAKGDKPSPTSRLNRITIDTKKGDDKATDYTSEQNDDQDDKTVDDNPTTDEDEQTEDVATDYTEEEEESDPSEDGDTDTDEGVDEEDPEATDYTQEGVDDDESSDATEGDGETDEEDPEADKEKENQRILLDDFVNLFYLVKNTISKLTTIDKSNIFINKIITQINANLNLMKQHLFDFITFEFESNKYVTNLFKYNYFLEAFRINTEMLKKINVFIPN